MINLHYSVPGFASKSGPIMYLPLPMLTCTKQSMFLPDKRKFDIDFPYTLEETENTVLTFPAGFVLDEKPESKKIDQNDIYFNSYSFAKERSIDMYRILRRRRNKFHPEEYLSVKEIFDAIFYSDQSQVVLSPPAD